jgi:hypothetical protein
MRHLQKIIEILGLSILIYACSSSPLKNGKTIKEEAVVIANDSLEYEVIIFDIGFNTYLNSIAKPAGYYSQNYLENWNNIYVTNWNIRAQNPTRYGQNIYQNIIDYSANIDYGMDVNYKLFNYFQFAQWKYKMRLDGGTGAPVRIR